MRRRWIPRVSGPISPMARYQAVIAGNLELADAEIALALQAAPNDAEVLAAAANMDVRHKQPDSALAKLQRAREIDPRSFLIVQRIGELSAVAGRPADAEEAYATQMILQPTNLTALQALAMQRVRQGKLDAAQAGDSGRDRGRESRPQDCGAVRRAAGSGVDPRGSRSAAVVSPDAIGIRR